MNLIVSFISNIDEDAEMQRIINQQVQMFVISERELEQHESTNNSASLNLNRNASTIINPGNEQHTEEDLMDYSYDKSFPSSSGSKVSTQGGIDSSPEGSGRVKSQENKNVNIRGGINASPDGRSNLIQMSKSSSSQGGLYVNPKGSNRQLPQKLQM